VITTTVGCEKVEVTTDRMPLCGTGRNLDALPGPRSRGRRSPNRPSVTGSVARVAHARSDEVTTRFGRADVVVLAVAVAVLLVSTAAAARGVGTLEADAFASVNGLPDWLYGPVWPVMQLGTVGLAATTGLVVGLVLRRPLLAALFALAPILAWWAAKVVKELLERGRPAAEGLTVTIRGTADDGYGFVSGHAAVSFALATVITPHLHGRWRVVPYALATIVALARLYVGAHLPLDVIGGAALGIVVGELVRAIESALDRRAAPA
jgi:membrane-associated phospholipid phosphatase